MNAYNALLQYVFPVIAGLLAYFLIFLTRRGFLRSKQIYRPTLFYLTTVTALSLFYFFLYTREIFLHRSAVSTVFRLFDYALYVLIPLSWLYLEISLAVGKAAGEKLSPAIVSRKDRPTGVLFTAANVFWAAALCLYLYLAGVKMNTGYYFSDTRIASFYHGLELAFAAVSSILLLAVWFRARRQIPSGACQVYTLLTTFFLSGYFFYTVWDTRNLGNIPYITWREEPLDLTGWFLLAANLLTVFFLFTCIEPEETASPEDGGGTPPETPAPIPRPLTETEQLDLLASRFDLTDREREITGLVASGESNQDISSQLFISLNTVKSHLKNIFRKCGVSSRMELAHLLSTMTREENEDAEQTGNTNQGESKAPPQPRDRTKAE